MRLVDGAYSDCVRVARRILLRIAVLELVADDAPGLLHRISRALSDFGCQVDLVLISTEASKAIDVFHMRKDDAKLADSDQLAWT